ncbi:putative ABC transport system permease protein [Lachnospiraceae bacterium PF1-21]|uniref:ABC transporter ATP-binding protein/permease n=1 Tax=Ohessyouella blattaphilus TaxID=2949333 RepID=A0ABT1EEB2_9FIRM|nr:ABC transporter ATP-binding protein/permease [Ohessyouella blattaphilus]MCP1109049.1 ABC transporter ATP-binding protein/permease [Ohessyouella blattaphilus]MCR8562443.1 ABC transporter ATP-binding protein/permease [Ohessyouella blattaphilus]
MLKITDIHKSYETAGFVQKALDGVSVTFRSNEFAAILGPSGSGKTTLLNVIGGLDHYDSGDLEIDGISTKKYKDKDWDAYRNNRIGFVFQSYNLIPHQTVLANVELALTLSGVSRKERRERAKEALAEVGLADHIRKLPSQLSGGQMQRVAIARALINDPEILLADEPTGALDTKTSTQVMDLLTQIAKNRLVVMVTHNNELAEDYATRIINLKDGQIQSDTDPYTPGENETPIGEPPRKVRMSFLTSVALSFSNLKSKLGRSFMIALAGSIGIIGIAAILALANGINDYIVGIEQDTMSLYPLTIQESGLDLSSLLGEGASESEEKNETKETANTNDTEVTAEQKPVREWNFVESIFNSRSQNDLKSLKTYIENNEKKIKPYTKSIEYKYNVTPQIYLPDTDTEIAQVNPDTLMNTYTGGDTGMSQMFSFGFSTGTSIFSQLPTDAKMYEDQYDVKAGRWPEGADEAVLVLGHGGSISDYTLYCLGLRDRQELKEMLEIFATNKDEDIEVDSKQPNYTYQQLMEPTFKVVNPSDQYTYDEEYKVWINRADNAKHMESVFEKSMDLKIVGVVEPLEDSSSALLTIGVNYTPDLVDTLMRGAATSDIVKKQLASPEINVLTGKTFADENAEEPASLTDFITVNEDKIRAAFNVDTSKLNMDFNALNNITLDTSGLALPALNLQELTDALAGQVNIPTEALTAILDNLMLDFIDYAADKGATTPEDIIALFPEYIALPEVQEKLNQEISTVVADSQIQEKVTGILQNYLSTTVGSYLQNALTTIQTQLAGQIAGQLQAALSTLPAQMQNALSIDQEMLTSAFEMKASEEDIMELMNALMNPTRSTLENNLTTLGYADPEAPSQINLYSKDFKSKESVDTFLKNYNAEMEQSGADDKVISYTDLVGTMMSSVTSIVDTISYALIAFVSISLVVSSIMIGVITYISVLERKKEIGILRAIGASKGNIRTVFNAETLIIGFVAGALGIGITYIMSFIANIIVYNRLDIKNITNLPITAAFVLILISMFLAFISGLIPSSAAARKDPVEALRSE